MHPKIISEEENTTYNPLVSIITPVLNGAKYLEACIESVLSQSYPHIEHVFIDGISSDGTSDVLSNYRANYPVRIRFISEPDRGSNDAANRGIRIARGGIFGLLPSDDMYEPDAIQTVVKFFRANPDAYFVFGDCNYINEKAEVIRRYRFKDFNQKKMVNGGCIFSGHCRTYYAYLMIDWLRPVLGPIYPFITKALQKRHENLGKG